MDRFGSSRARILSWQFNHARWRFLFKVGEFKLDIRHCLQGYKLPKMALAHWYAQHIHETEVLDNVHNKVLGTW